MGPEALIRSPIRIFSLSPLQEFSWNKYARTWLTGCVFLSITPRLDSCGLEALGFPALFWQFLIYWSSPGSDQWKRISLSFHSPSSGLLSTLSWNPSVWPYSECCVILGRSSKPSEPRSFLVCKLEPVINPWPTSAVIKSLVLRARLPVSRCPLWHLPAVLTWHLPTLLTCLGCYNRIS